MKTSASSAWGSAPASGAVEMAAMAPVDCVTSGRGLCPPTRVHNVSDLGAVCVCVRAETLKEHLASYHRHRETHFFRCTTLALLQTFHAQISSLLSFLASVLLSTSSVCLTRATRGTTNASTSCLRSAAQQPRRACPCAEGGSIYLVESWVPLSAGQVWPPCLRSATHDPIHHVFHFLI